MAQPRVFISSTHYDLKYIRSSLEFFVESLGYHAVLSEKGRIAYSPDLPPDESCYREVQNSDIYVLIIGGRFGSEISDTREDVPRTFFDRYESVTKLEYKAAVEKDIPINILVESSVYAEYQTFQRNRDNETVKYAQVDSVNVFYFLDEIFAQPKNNAFCQFDRYIEIEEWLRSQWAGWFGDLLRRRSEQQQITTLASQVNELAEITKTIRRYLEEVVAKVSPENSQKIIHSEETRLNESRIKNKLDANPYVRFLISTVGISFDQVRAALDKAVTIEEFIHTLKEQKDLPKDVLEHIRGLNVPSEGTMAFDALNEARKIVGAPKFAPPVSSKETAQSN